MARWEALKSENLKTGRAWSIKEMFRQFWQCSSSHEANRFFRRWYQWASRCRLEPVFKVAKMFKRHLPNILTYFSHRLTNAPIEGLNNKIAAIVKKAYEHRNLQRLKNDILFHLGGLPLYLA